MSEWQDIGSAPRDGTVVDLWIQSKHGYKFRLTDCKWGQSDWAHGGSKDWVYEKRDDDEPHRNCSADVEYDFGERNLDPLDATPSTSG